ncbi:HRDC domain-containing protein, partial [Nonomuraea fuscirosea]
DPGHDDRRPAPPVNGTCLGCHARYRHAFRPAEAAPVFERLRSWRGATAKEQGVPAYVIFHDATLREIATRMPTTLTELSQVNGVGENKLAKYGDQVLEALGGDDPDE